MSGKSEDFFRHYSMKKDMIDVVFLTTFIGAGHKRVAEVIEEQLRKRNISCLIINIFEKLTPHIDTTLKHLYITSIKYAPWLWRSAYYKNQSSGIEIFFLKILARRLKRLLWQLQPKVIVCTQAIPCKLLSFFDVIVPKVAIITDFATHNYWLNKKMDAFVCSVNNVERLMKAGIPKEKIYAFGIPTCIDSSFTSHRSNDKKDNKKVVMVMGGGEGLGLGIVIPLIINFEKMNKNFHFIVLYGRNRSVYKRLKNLENCQLIPYTTDIQKLYAMSDILVTKPGGITLQEAINCGIKLILLPPCAKNESINVEFLTKHEAAIPVVQNSQQLAKLLTAADIKLAAVNAKKLAAPEATEKTLQLILSLF